VIETNLELRNTKKWEITSIGIIFKDELDYEEWFDLGCRLGKLEGAVQWLIGDWAAAEGRVLNGIHSDAYDLLEEQTGLARTTIEINKYVAESVDLLIRINRLSWSHHRQVAALPPAEQKRWLALAAENSWSVSELKKQIRKALPTPKLPLGKYRIIYADPPWEYDMPQHTAGKATVRKAGEQVTVLETYYPSMSLEEIKALPVADLAANDCVLFLWTTVPKIYEAQEVIGAWDFIYKSQFVWDKVKHNVGHWVSIRHELLLICSRGQCEPDNPKLLDSVVSIERGEHSAKPVFFRDCIDQLYPPSDGQRDRIELFARGQLPSHWDGWGNEYAQ